jgi:hypothetical protein
MVVFTCETSSHVLSTAVRSFRNQNLEGEQSREELSNRCAKREMFVKTRT